MPARPAGDPIHKLLTRLVFPVLLATTGCVKVYQPLNGLHRPMVVDPTQPNFEDLDLTLDCVPSDFVNRNESRRLCERVGTLFENQGARVSILDDGLAAEGEEPAYAPPGTETVAAAEPERRADLTIQLEGRQLNKGRYPLSWILCVGSFTVLPGISESSFSQKVSIRDGTGFLISTDTLEGRIISRFGLGTWVGNSLMDWLVRPREEHLGSGSAHRDFSTDFYGQLSQIAFNAKMHWQVLQEASAEAP